MKYKPHVLTFRAWMMYTAYKNFMNGIACRGFDSYGAIISAGRCQTTLVCKSAK